MDGSNPPISASDSQSRINQDLDARRRNLLAEQQAKKIAAAENPMATTDDTNPPLGADSRNDDQELLPTPGECQRAPPSSNH
jgi:hypothetical protein